MAAHDSSTIHPVSAQACSFPQLTDVHDYLLLDRFDTVFEVRRMRPSEARDTNAELQALNAPCHWELAGMTD